MAVNIKKSIGSLSSSVGTTVILIFFGLALIITIFFSFIDYNRKFQVQISNLNIRLDQIQGGFIDSLTNSLWKIDDEQTHIILESILRQEDIELVKVIDKDKILYRMGKSVEDIHAINRTYPLTIDFEGSKKYIGDLEIIASKKNMKKLLNKEIKYFIMTELIKVIFFVFCTLIFIKVIITRHLDSITEFFTKNNIYNSQKKLVLNRGYEFWKNSEDNFDVLVSSINVMTEKLHEELQDRKKAEFELTQMNEQLERRVELKTKQLLETDRIEAVIEMSAGIAHEINSPLSVVFGLNKRLEKLISKDVIKKEDISKLTHILGSSVNRIFSITNALHMLSNVSESEGENETNSVEMINDTMEGVKQIFKSSIGDIDYVISPLPKKMIINKNLFYQFVYMMVHLRSKAMLNIEKKSWLRIEFTQHDGHLIVTCYDCGKKLKEEEMISLLDAFKTKEQRSRGSLLLFGTFSSLVHKLGAKINFIDHNEDIFLQVRIPIKDNE
jgi:C4-dicarboxylate-specific signal transduction histidine kinase